MKAKITKKQAKCLQAIATGYCDIQHLLYCENPIFYTAGIYGRGADIYKIDGHYICTGYDPVGARADYKTAREYDKKAEKVLANRTRKRETKQKKIRKLLQDFITICEIL